MNIQEFAKQVAVNAAIVRKENQSLSAATALMLKTKQRSIEDAVYEEARIRTIRQAAA